MFRKVKIAFLIAWASALAGPAFSIGLGEIELKTPLNEPLRAEIQLLQLGDMDENDLRVGIAPKEDFEAAGVERLFFLTSLKFVLDLDNPKGPMIIVKTDAPVREPYLNFLLEVQWPSGRLLREYTLLMDLPTFTESESAIRAIRGTETAVAAPAPAVAPLDVAALEAELAAADQEAPVAAPIVSTEAAPALAEESLAAAADATPASEQGSAANEPAPDAVASTEPAPAGEVQPAEPTMAAEEPAVQPAPVPAPSADYQPAVPVYANAPGEHTVVAGDTLWDIAVRYRQQASECTGREFRCEDGITIQQAMLAVQRLNPDAFVNGNINQLKKGPVLRMPTQDQVTEVTSREAVAEVMKQNIAWSGDPNGRRGAAVASEQLDATVAEGGVAEETSPDYEEGRLKLTTPGAADGSQTAAAVAAETSKVEALQNELVIAMEELDRVKREKSGAADQIVSLNDQVKTIEKMLQVRSAELQALQAAAAKAQAEANAASVEAPAEVAAPEEAPTTSVADGTAAEEVAPVEQQPAPVEEPVAAEKISEKAVAAEPGIVDTLMANLLYIVGGIGVLLVAGLAVVMLRKRAARKANLIEDDEVSMDHSARDEEFSEEVPSETEGEDSLDDSFAEESLDLPEADESAPAKPETSDALGEADIYISFGSYDKAESLLKSAIAVEPERTDLQLKLLEVYTETDNLSAFDKQYSKLSELGDEGALERAREMRSRINGAADTLLPGSSVASSGADEFDLDLGLDSGTDFSTSDTGSNEKMDFDLDLSLDLEEPASEAPTGINQTVSISDAPTMQQRAVNISDAPTVQQRAINISDMPTAISPAVKASESKTEVRDELDLDLSALDSELDEIAQKDFSAEVTRAIANDEPTPANTALDEEFDFLADADEAATKLDLARAYIDMGDKDGARDILQEVMEEGKDAQKAEARKLLDSLG